VQSCHCCPARTCSGGVHGAHLPGPTLATAGGLTLEAATKPSGSTVITRQQPGKPSPYNVLKVLSRAWASSSAVANSLAATSTRWSPHRMPRVQPLLTAVNSAPQSLFRDIAWHLRRADAIAGPCRSAVPTPHDPSRARVATVHSVSPWAANGAPAIRRAGNNSPQSVDLRFPIRSIALCVMRPLPSRTSRWLDSPARRIYRTVEAFDPADRGRSKRTGVGGERRQDANNLACAVAFATTSDWSMAACQDA
jgi:hypothetical protein